MTKQIMQERNCDNQGGKWKLIQGKKTTNSWRSQYGKLIVLMKLESIWNGEMHITKLDNMIILTN
jgi:hypothetical protein